MRKSRIDLMRDDLDELATIEEEFVNVNILHKDKTYSTFVTKTTLENSKIKPKCKGNHHTSSISISNISISISNNIKRCDTLFCSFSYFSRFYAKRCPDLEPYECKDDETVCFSKTLLDGTVTKRICAPDYFCLYFSPWKDPHVNLNVLEMNAMSNRENKEWYEKDDPITSTAAAAPPS
ncbi:hypothetical protein PRIPAC_87465 [Pristionchus pacificus]|uniref:Uncharacterized protein n=1 Tax=Pristionchus pacificus TaxID=54126 RepID=A0A2A6B7R1_PRIPA|nr:hypothetical protein PRIPAC_87465 [Pristionchus pacificus]|eukprot:PDM61904.1 hypothetical protein PRIPAC_51346 [Pristionchus pacificus]